MSAEGADRAARVRGLVRRPGLDLLVWRRSWWEGNSPGETSFLVGMVASVLLLFLEAPLWMGRPLPVPAWLQLSHGAAILALGAPLVTGWLLDPILEHRAGRGGKIAYRWRALRFALASTPLLSFYAPALWRRLLASPALRPSAPPLDLTGESGGPEALPLWRHRRALSLLPYLWVGSGILGPLLGALWLGTMALGGGIWKRVALGICILLHLGAATCLSHHFRGVRRRSQAAGARAALLVGLPLLWLFPLPIAAVTLLALPALDSWQETPLVTTLYWRRWNASRLPAWLDLEEDLRRSWRTASPWRKWRRPGGLERPVRAGRAEKRLRMLFRWKALLLVFEGVALAVGLARLGRLAPTLVPILSVAWPWIAWSSAALCGLGLAGQGILLVARLLRITPWIDLLDGQPYGRALLSTHAAFLTGLIAGQLLVEGRGKELCLWLAYAGALAAVVGALHLLLTLALPSGRRIREQAREAAVLPISILGLLVLEIALLRSGGLGRLVGTLEILAALCPLWALASGLTLGRWLLRPYTWSDLLSPGLPTRIRLPLTFLAVTSLLPLGGLAMPLWIFGRHRLTARADGGPPLLTFYTKPSAASL